MGGGAPALLAALALAGLGAPQPPSFLAPWALPVEGQTPMARGAPPALWALAAMAGPTLALLALAEAHSSPLALAALPLR